MSEYRTGDNWRSVMPITPADQRYDPPLANVSAEAFHATESANRTTGRDRAIDLERRSAVTYRWDWSWL